MFDRYLIGRQSVPDVNIKVEQQPNDATDAARLYGELKAKAELEVANAVVDRLGAHNELTVIRVRKDENFATAEILVQLIFKLNDTLHVVVCTAAREDLTSLAYGEVAKTILREITNHFTKANL